MSFTSSHLPSSTTIIILALTPFVLLTLSYFTLYGNEFHLESVFVGSSCETPPIITNNTSTAAGLRLFMGILTVPHQHERRNLLRSVYAVQTRQLTNDYADVRFIFCHSMNEEETVFLSIEIMLYNDIIILDCYENMNEGKTYAYFSSLPSLLASDNRHYDYVIKTDDDAYFRLDNLAKFLSNKPREDLYYGMELSCVGPQAACGRNNTFMAGFGYVLSWDLVKWIAESDIAKNNKVGLEDVMLGKWLNEGNKGKNRYNGMPNQLYDYKGDDSPDGYFRHDFVPDTVAIHKLKENLHWARTLRYFNVTHD
ncbi:hypothetical protein LUZ60_016415 [Juncus effusus]|nr:hypothetical protein LUZ60_016415 [Juncus effusus]